jgi:acetyl esterase/lipase
VYVTACIRTSTFLILFSAVCAVSQQPTAAELDIHYGKESDAQVLDLYFPAKKGFSTVVYTYGGGWHSGSGKSSKPIAEELVRFGYGCALISHRLFPPDAFPAPAEDLAAAIAWVKANIAIRGGDPKRVILAGHSSGAHLSLLVATDPRRRDTCSIGLASFINASSRPEHRLPVRSTCP